MRNQSSKTSRWARPWTATFALFTIAAHLPAAAPPNFVVILADDAGYADFGFQGGGIRGDFARLTPNIDSIATGGVKFSSGYVTGPVCCPSRAGLITGRHQQRFGMEQNVSDEPGAGLPTSEKTIADTLKALGYRTYAIGKWHLGQDLPEHHPNRRGFDEYFGFLSGARTYRPFTGVSPASKLQRNGTVVAEPADQPYLTDLFGAEAAAMIDAHATSHASQPFLLYLAFNGVHTPLEADPARLADPRIQGITVPNRKTLAAMTIALDDAVGVVLAKLAQRGLAQNTLIAFLSDNGGPEDKESLNAPNWSDNGPLREGKTLLYEGGIRVPFALKWPAGLAPALVGTTLPDPVTALDLLPTFVAAAGGALLPGQETDGHSLLPRLTGASRTPLQRLHFWRIGGSTRGQSAVRAGDWKLVRNDSTGAVELFNLATDLGEANDLAVANPAKVADLVAAHAAWEAGMVEPLWGGGEPTISNANLVRRSAAPGYELEKTGTGYSYLANEVRAPFALARDWTATWRMESVAKAGYERNGGIVLGDRLAVNRFIRVSVGFASRELSITELQNNATTTGLLPAAIPAGALNEFRLTYTAASRTLSLQYGATLLAHPLTGTYDGNLLDFAGYTLQNSALTRFSPIEPQVFHRAPAVSPTWARLNVARDYVPGTRDPAGNFMGGTEGMSLVVHKGRLYAGIGYWNDLFFGAGSPDPHPGPQVLVKESHAAPWKQDLAAGSAFLRIENLTSVTLTTDKNGTPVRQAVNLLLAGSGEMPPPYGASTRRRPVVWIRNDTTGTWTPTYPGPALTGGRTTRLIANHIDSVTGVHHVFVGFGEANNTLVRGGYNSATGLIDWEADTPELTGTERMLSAGECNGVLYACIGSNGVEGDNVGGVFWREDGPSPRWHFVYEWPDTGRQNPDVRGFTAVPHPQGLGYEAALVTLEAYGKVFRIDPIGGNPRNGHIVTEELNIQTFLGDAWNNGVSIGFPTLSAYNDMPEVVHPGTRQPVNLIGVAVAHPAGYGTPEGNSSYYLVRHRDAKYEWGRVFDPNFPLPNNGPGENGLRATRALRLSPFPEDGGRVLYFSGFDAASQRGAIWHNTAWIYRGELVTDAPGAGSSRLANLSVRSSVGAGDQALIVGFVVAGGNKNLLIRGVGPALTQFGVGGALVDPLLGVYSGGTVLLSNDNWESAQAAEKAATAAAVGAFALPAGGRDAAVLPTLGGGAYTAQLSGGGGTTGIALLELYDAAGASTARLVNASARTQVGTGANQLIAGFTIAGTAPKTVLVRAIGPTLASFGVAGALADPTLTVLSNRGPLATNDNWSVGSGPAVAQAASAVGAFALPSGSRDAALLLTLAPGSYTAQVAGVRDTTGVALVEIYDVP